MKCGICGEEGHNRLNKKHKRYKLQNRNAINSAQHFNVAIIYGFRAIVHLLTAFKMDSGEVDKKEVIENGTD